MTDVVTKLELVIWGVEKSGREHGQEHDGRRKRDERRPYQIEDSIFVYYGGDVREERPTGCDMISISRRGESTSVRGPQPSGESGKITGLTDPITSQRNVIEI